MATSQGTKPAAVFSKCRFSAFDGRQSNGGVVMVLLIECSDSRLLLPLELSVLRVVPRTEKSSPNKRPAQ